MKKVIIVGAGVSGLSAGTFLQKNGYQVEIYEKNPYAGGFLTSWVRKGNIIDGCLHWMLGTKKGTKMNNIWRELGALDDSINLIKTNTFYSVEYEGNTFNLYTEFDKLKNEFLKYSQDDDQEINKMFDTISWLMQSDYLEVPSDIAYDLLDISTMKMDMEFMKKSIYYVKMDMYQFAAKFNSPIIKWALTNSLINAKFNAFYFIQTLANFIVGNDQLPEGGSHKMRDRMVERFESLGGKIILCSDVEKILVEDNTAKGIRVKGKDIYADYVISAADMHFTYEKLLDRKIEDTEYQKFDSDSKYSCYSYVIASYKTNLNMKDKEVAVIEKINPYSFMNKEYDYLSIRSYSYDDTLINNGYTTIQVMITTYEDEYKYVNSLDKEAYKKLKEDIGLFFKAKLEEKYNSEFELIDVCTPHTYERYNHSHMGTFMPYALAPRMNQVIKSFKSDINNLVFANQWLLSPGGVGVASVNGKMAAQLIMSFDCKDYKNI